MNRYLTNIRAIGSRLFSTSSLTQPGAPNGCIRAQCAPNPFQPSQSLLSGKGHLIDERHPPDPNDGPLWDGKFGPGNSFSLLRMPVAQQDDVAVNEYADLITQAQLEAKPKLGSFWDLQDTGRDYREELLRALRLRDPDRLLRAFHKVANSDPDFIRTIPPTTFSAILELLDPDYFVARIQKTHQEMSSNDTVFLGTGRLHDVFHNFLHLTRDVVEIRRRAGRRLCLADYRHLLRGARAVGSKQAARTIWRELVRDGLSPDGICYNHLMGAIVWNGCYHPEFRHHLRVLPGYIATPPRFIPGLRLPYRIGEGGINTEIQVIYDDMMRAGVQADEETHTLRMMAAAREGKVDEVKEIMRRMWNIDVDEIMDDSTKRAGTPRHAQPPTSYDYPSVRLLHTAADCFAINSSMDVVFKLLQHISRTYSIPIPLSVWSHVFQWTYVYSSPDLSPNQLATGQGVGRLRPTTLYNLWITLRSPPYNIVAPFPMFDRAIGNLYHSRRGKAMLETIYEAMPYQEEFHSRARRTFHTVQHAADAGAPEYVLAALRRRFRHDETVLRRNRAMIRSWVRHALALTWTSRNPPPEEWVLRDVPDLLRNLADFAPTSLRYIIPGGKLEFDLRTPEELRLRAELKQKRAAMRAETLGGGLVDDDMGEYEPPKKSTVWTESGGEFEDESETVDDILERVMTPSEEPVKNVMDPSEESREEIMDSFERPPHPQLTGGEGPITLDDSVMKAIAEEPDDEYYPVYEPGADGSAGDGSYGGDRPPHWRDALDYALREFTESIKKPKAGRWGRQARKAQERDELRAAKRGTRMGS